MPYPPPHMHRNTARSPPTVPTRTSSLAINQSGPSNARLPRCAVCHRILPRSSQRLKIEHINKCWSQRAENAKRERNEFQQKISALDRLDMIWNALNGLEKARNLLPSINQNLAYLGSEGRVSREATSASTASKQNTPTEDSKPLPTTTATPSLSCYLCTLNLSRLMPSAAFDHSILCTIRHRPQHCPLCLIPFTRQPSTTTTTSTSTPSSILWPPEHIVSHIATHHCTSHPFLYSPETLNALIQAWKDRCEMLVRTLEQRIGPRKMWTARQHRESYGTKRDDGMRSESRGYRLAESPLRWGMVVEEVVGMEVKGEVWGKLGSMRTAAVGVEEQKIEVPRVQALGTLERKMNPAARVFRPRQRYREL